MNITIVGIGALGCLFAGRLANLANVWMLGHWPEQVHALQQDGLTLLEPAGGESHFAVQVTDDPTVPPPADLLLVLVKSYQTAQAIAQAKALLAPEGLVLTLQNGLGNLEQIAAVVGAERAALGTTSEGAAVVRPGVVRHAGRGLTHLAGEQLRPVASLFQAAGFNTHLVDQADVDSLLWGKLAVNAGINPLTALLRRPNGYLLENEAARQLMETAANETATVAAAQGIPLPYASAAERAAEVAQATAANLSSMLQDVLNGRPTEIDAICGAIVRLGHEHGVPVPTNELLLRLIEANASGR